MIIKKALHLRQSARETKDLILRGTTPFKHNCIITYKMSVNHIGLALILYMYLSIFHLQIIPPVVYLIRSASQIL